MKRMFIASLGLALGLSVFLKTDMANAGPLKAVVKGIALAYPEAVRHNVGILSYGVCITKYDLSTAPDAETACESARTHLQGFKSLSQKNIAYRYLSRDYISEAERLVGQCDLDGLSDFISNLENNELSDLRDAAGITAGTACEGGQ